MRGPSPQLVLLSLILVCYHCQDQDRSSKLLNVFNIVKFPNDACSSGENYGSCYTGRYSVLREEV